MTGKKISDSFEEIVQQSQSSRILTPTGKETCTLVEYSAKAVAVFGDTKSIKYELKAMGGRFNSHLTFNGKRLAGWIFSKSQEHQLAHYFGLD